MCNLDGAIILPFGNTFLFSIKKKQSLEPKSLFFPQKPFSLGKERRLNHGSESSALPKFCEPDSDSFGFSCIKGKSMMHAAGIKNSWVSQNYF